MKNIAMVIHGGASESSPFIKKNTKEIKAGLEKAVLRGYEILQKGGSALDAVESAVIYLEDNPLFNAGRGSVLNANGEVEMDAAIMDGKTLKAGAVSMVQGVKNPIVLARTILQKTPHVLLGGYGAFDFAKKENLDLKENAYFITPHQLIEFERERHEKFGTVGAVALDKKGNLAAATSTGGIGNCLPGRIGDSCVIGAGCYANNKTAAVSGTGEGEYLIRHVIGHSIAMLSQNMSLEEACSSVIPPLKIRNGFGVISVNAKGAIGIRYNTKIMKRAWIGLNKQLFVEI